MSGHPGEKLADRLAGLSPLERARLLERLREKKQTAAPAEVIPPRDRASDPPPLSFAQQRLWFLDRLRPGDPVYNIPTPLAVTGPLDVAALHRALNAIVERHEGLRTTFGVRDEVPVQLIAPRLALELPVADLSSLPRERGDAEAGRLRDEDELRPFDLAAGPLLRATLLRLASEEETERHFILLTFHHIISDGWSGTVLIGELTALYGGGALDPLPIQYADFAVWQRRELSGQALERRLAVWRERLAGAPPVLELPSDRPRGVARTSRGGSVFFQLEPAVAGPLHDLARRQGATPFIVLLAAYQALLHRLTGRDDLSVGAPAANRGRAETAGLIGFFVNTLVLRGDLSGDPRFAELVDRLRPVAFDAFAHQDVPFEKLVEELRPERETGRPPLVQVALLLQNFPTATGAVRGLRVDPLPVHPKVAKMDLTMTLEEIDGRFQAMLQYSADLFDAPTVERLAASFVTLTAAACAVPDRRLAELPLLGEVEQAQLLREHNDTAAPAADPALIPERFARQAALHPERPAVVAEDVTWTWGELARRVAELAAHLRSLGAGPETRVAKVADRTPETIVAMLAVMTAGATWVPLDPTLPEARRQELVEISGALSLDHGLARTNTDEHGLQEGFDLSVGVGDRPCPSVLHPEAPVYLIFTSGSTGTPKGVVVEHRHLRHYVDAVARLLGPAAAGSWAVVSTLAADLGHTAIFPALCSGGTLHLMSPERALDPEAFADYAERHRIDAMKIVPSHLAALLAGSRPAAVLPCELLVLGGEATPWELAGRIAELAPDLRVLNHYGPTETTVGAIAGPIGRPPQARSRRPPLGRPLANVEAHLLDRGLQPVPTGVPGELFLGGGGVARGYLGQPDRTAELFLPHPFAGPLGTPGARVYRTGDLARRLPDGSLEFLGRVDDQVKIRGFRVEPGEVEAALARHPAVRECAVLVRQQPGGATLAAYVVRSGEVDAEGLRGWLAERLPAALVPSGWVVLEALPLTANGKVDRQSLLEIRPEMALPAGREDAATALPRTSLEREIGAIWCEVLGIERVGASDSFFDLGGHSLLLPRVQAGLRERLGRDVPLIVMFAHPTVAALAAWLENRDEPDPGDGGDDARERIRRQRQGLEMQRRRAAQRRPA
ncbi:MAG TPA: amino acid adenylation domain-containing protein [Thermoanaerobaculia bacterium]|nr:amino acid adenylation domain-containing protein [Thermoanaerobaculia bacterium]